MYKFDVLYNMLNQLLKYTEENVFNLIWFNTSTLIFFFQIFRQNIELYNNIRVQLALTT